jgi:hypothetical protein
MTMISKAIFHPDRFGVPESRVNEIVESLKAKLRSEALGTPAASQGHSSERTTGLGVATDLVRVTVGSRKAGGD